MTVAFCDDRGAAGFSWIVEEPATRTSHALAADGDVWLVDPVRHQPALVRAGELGVPRAVLQLLDRHNRDCAAIAAELNVSHLVVPDAVPDSPFELVTVKRSKRWRESALWWPATRTLVQVNLENAGEADHLFTTLMGEKVGPRKDFIRAEARKVQNLDV